MGSLVDILSYDCFKQRNLDVELIRVDITLCGFCMMKVQLVDEVVLLVTLGMSKHRKVKTVRFLVVDTKPASNFIFLRPSHESKVSYAK